MEFNVNPYYHGHTLKDLLDPNLTYWVHHGRHILKQGRTIWWNPMAGMVSANCGPSCSLATSDGENLFMKSPRQ